MSHLPKALFHQQDLQGSYEGEAWGPGIEEEDVEALGEEERIPMRRAPKTKTNRHFIRPSLKLFFKF